jgi:hypothetical protein
MIVETGILWQRISASIVLAVVLTGCEDARQQSRGSNLNRLATAYSQYLAHHGGQLPVNEIDLKSFIRSQVSGGIDDAQLATFLVSERDQKPYRIRYRTDKNWHATNIVAYEQQGLGGIRLAANSGGSVLEWSDEEFRVATKVTR